MTAIATDAPAQSDSLFARLRPLLGMLGRHRLLVWYAIACGMAYQVVALAVAGTAAWLVGQAATGASAAQLRGGLILLGALVLPAALLRWGDWYLAHVAAYLVLADMRCAAYAAFERLSPGYLLERRSGDLGAAVMSEIEMLESWVAHTLSPLVVAVTVPLAALIALAVFDPAVALALVPVLAMLVSVPAWLRRQATAQGDEMRARLGELNAETVDVFQGLRELVTFGARCRRLERVASQEDGLLAAKVAHGRRAGLEHAATDALTVLGLVAVLVVAAVQVTRGQLEPALFPVAVILAATTFMPVLQVLDVVRELNLVGAAAVRVLAILDAPAPVSDLVSEPPPGPIQPAVRFEHVSFRYAPELPDAITDVSFDIAPGETVALVGHSGAGKSTCAHLVLRLWDVRAGAISIGGHDVRAFPQEALRELLTFVPQDVFLFNISLRDNIRMARPDASDADVEAAARAALADEFITGLPDGYDTVAGELGGRLSGGQRQRIALARALLKDAPILVMDEAVSNLDAASEQEVAAAMAHARQGRTTLLIAHRLSTIRSADRLVVLDHGRVAEVGSHDQLIARDGVYARLIASQLAGAAEQIRGSVTHT